PASCGQGWGQSSGRRKRPASQQASRFLAHEMSSHRSDTKPASGTPGTASCLDNGSPRRLWSRPFLHRNGDSMVVWLKVPFAEKDEAKALGARWSPAQKKWYVKEGADPAP